MALLRRWAAPLEGGRKGPVASLGKGLMDVSVEMSLPVIAYKLKRAIGIFGVAPLVAAIGR